MPATLPPLWSIRHPTLDDVPAILEVVHASDIAAVGEADFSAEEIVEILTAPNHDPARDSWLAVDPSERIAGWAFIENPLRTPRETFDAYVHPAFGAPAHAVLLDLVVARIAERAREAGLPSLLASGGAIASEEHYVSLLRAAGFTFVKRFARMRRALDGPQPRPEPSAWVVVRPVRPDDDADLRSFHAVLDTAFRDTPGYEPSTYEAYRERVTALPNIDWDEWLVAEVEGVHAAILQSSAQVTQADEGWVKYLAVRREFRGRGMGRLLLLTAFHIYAAKGRTAAGLGVDLTNPTGAYRLYESVGMRPVYESDSYERTILAA